MTVIVEDGTIVPGANSYATASQANSYFLVRGTTTNIADADMIKSAQFVDARYGSVYKGFLVDASTQPMLYPRTSFTDNLGRPVNTGTIPVCLLEAQYQAALLSSQGVTLSDNASSDSLLSSSTKTVEGAVSKSESYFAPVNRAPTAFIRGIISPICHPFLANQSQAVRG